MSRITLTLDKVLNAAQRARALADGGRSRSSVVRDALIVHLEARKKTAGLKTPDTRPESSE